MPSIYTSQAPVSQGSVGPAGSTFAPIPGLGTLTVTDQELQFGGTAYLSLFLGQAYWSSQMGVSFLNVAINELVSGTTICQIYCTNGNQVSNMINISTTYNIAPNTQPQFSASWMVQRAQGVAILTPTTFSFSAMVFENLS